MSEGVLRQFGRSVEVVGMPWQRQGEMKRLQPSNLTANILCDRHNTSLSPLDAAASSFFDRVTQAFAYIDGKSLSRKPRFFLVSGDGLERWAMKTLLGMYYGGIAAMDGVQMRNNVPFNDGFAIQSILGAPLATPLGTYLPLDVGQPLLNRIGLAILTGKSTGNVVGLRVMMRALAFDFIADDLREATAHNLRNPRLHRPTLIDVGGDLRTSRLYLSWGRDVRQINRVQLGVGRYKV